ncbi:protein PFC0760c isoform X2 [Eurytemora carolleeae]|uniref:protein PFC0760c isoform X2 n=1 Tax=Eurytemora carolleeae TaxID=1294199 RepID=UPI000C756060|nr:protein PFC0760c isoform X2 [Eurytemora carolleeae]|eukprot:XP_023330430.1 protein PFC0760c-like isoform X2 [Eurytemora affinis]
MVNFFGKVRKCQLITGGSTLLSGLRTKFVYEVERIQEFVRKYIYVRENDLSRFLEDLTEKSWSGLSPANRQKMIVSGVLQPILKIYLAHKTMENMITALVGKTRKFISDVNQKIGLDDLIENILESKGIDYDEFYDDEYEDNDEEYEDDVDDDNDEYEDDEKRKNDKVHDDENLEKDAFKNYKIDKNNDCVENENNDGHEHNKKNDDENEKSDWAFRNNSHEKMKDHEKTKKDDYENDLNDDDDECKKFGP